MLNIKISKNKINYDSKINIKIIIAIIKNQWVNNVKSLRKKQRKIPRIRQKLVKKQYWKKKTWNECLKWKAKEK